MLEIKPNKIIIGEQTLKSSGWITQSSVHLRYVVWAKMIKRRDSVRNQVLIFAVVYSAWISCKNLSEFKKIEIESAIIETNHRWDQWIIIFKILFINESSSTYERGFPYALHTTEGTIRWYSLFFLLYLKIYYSSTKWIIHQVWLFKKFYRVKLRV